uniref:Gag-pol polyprotein n=1 Tax=Globodera pallida TaxID=36090 RepID=A0A183CL03_GLOPA
MSLIHSSPIALSMNQTTVEQIEEDVVEVCVIHSDVDDDILLVHDEVDLPNVTEDIDKQPAKKKLKRAR